MNASAHNIATVQCTIADRSKASLSLRVLWTNTFHTPEERQREAALSQRSKSLGLRDSDQYSVCDTSARRPTYVGKLKVMWLST